MSRSRFLLGSEHRGESRSGHESRTWDRSGSHRGTGGAGGIHTQTFLSPASPSTSHWPIGTWKPAARKAGVWFLEVRLGRDREVWRMDRAQEQVALPAAPEQQPAAARSALDRLLASVGKEAAQVYLESQFLLEQQAAWASCLRQLPKCHGGHAEPRPGRHCATLSCATAEEQ